MQPEPSLTTRTRIDDAAESFESRLRSGQSASISSWLDEYADLPRTELFRELMGAEVDFLIETGQPIDPQRYLEQFPDMESAVVGVLQSRNVADVSKHVTFAVTEPDISTAGVRDDPDSAGSDDQPQDPVSPTIAGLRPDERALTTAHAPRMIGDYEIIRVIDSTGGMGVVYEAWAPDLKRSVALKVIKSGEAASAQDTARFRTEAEAMAQLQHPNIVTIHHLADYGSQFCIVMEYCSGGTLAARSDDERKPGLREAVQWIEAIADAISHSHAAGILHRDLKPKNVFFDSRGNPRVGDFGLAKLPGSNGETLPGEVMGTPSYMAPEQAKPRSGNEIDERTDVYGLGGLLYFVLTGKAPFGGYSLQETLERITTSDPVPIGMLEPSTPRDLVTICDKCLRKNKQDRYRSASDLRDDLRNYLDGRPIKARPRSAVENLRNWGRRNRKAAAVMSGFAVLSMVAVAFALSADRMRNEADRHAAELEIAVLTRDEFRLHDVHRNVREALSRGDIDLARRSIAQRPPGPAGSPDEHWLNSVMNRITGRMPAIWCGHMGALDTAWNTDRRQLAVADQSGGLYRIDLSDEDYPIRHEIVPATFHPIKKYPIRPIDCPEGTSPPTVCQSVDWSNNSQLITGWSDGRIICFPDGSGPAEDLMQLDTEVLLIRSTADGKLLIADGNNRLMLTDHDGARIAETSTDGVIQCILRHEDGDYWFVGTEAGELIWLDGELNRIDAAELQGSVTGLACHAVDGGLRIYPATRVGRIRPLLASDQARMLQILSALPVSRPKDSGSFESVTITNNDRELWALGSESRLTVWDLRDDRVIYHGVIGREWNTLDNVRDPDGRSKRNGEPFRVRREDMPAAFRRTQSAIHHLTRGRLLCVAACGTAVPLNSSQIRVPKLWQTLEVGLNGKSDLKAAPGIPHLYFAMTAAGQLFEVRTDTGTVRRLLDEVHPGGDPVLRLLSEGRAITSAGGRNAAIIDLKPEAVRVLRRIPLKHELRGIAVSESRDLAALKDERSVVTLVRLSTGEAIRELSQLTSGEPASPALEFSPDGRFLAVYGPQSEFCVYDLDNDCRVCRLTGVKGYVQWQPLALAWSPVRAGCFLVGETYSSGPGFVEGFTSPDIGERSPLSVRQHTPDVAFRISDKTKRIAALSRDGRLAFLNPDLFFPLAEFVVGVEPDYPTDHSNRPVNDHFCSFAMSADEKSVLTATESGRLILGRFSQPVEEEEPDDSLLRTDLQLTGRVFRLKDQPEDTERRILSRPAPDRQLRHSLVVHESVARERRGDLLLLRRSGTGWELQPIPLPDERLRRRMWLHGAAVRHTVSGSTVIATRATLNETTLEEGPGLLLESSGASWSVRKHHVGGNAGHYPILVEGPDGRIEKVIHFDFTRKGIYSSTADADSPTGTDTWNEVSEVWGTGLRLDGFVDSQGTAHLIGSSFRYSSDPSISSYVKFPRKGPAVIEPLRYGRMFAGPDEAPWLLVFDSHDLLERVGEKWVRRTELPKSFDVPRCSVPVTAADGSVWLVTNHAGSILLLRWLDDQWMTIQVVPDQPVKDGYLTLWFEEGHRPTIAVNRGMDLTDGIVVIEVTLPQDLKPKAAATKEDGAL